MESFESQWKKITAALQSKQEKIISEAASQVFKKVVDRTPYGRPELWKSGTAPANYQPGTLRKGWEINWGNGYIHPVSSYSGKLSSVAGKESYRLGSDIYIKNSTPYAYVIEYGKSRIQAPQGMMRRSIKEYQRILNTVASKYKI